MNYPSNIRDFDNHPQSPFYEGPTAEEALEEERTERKENALIKAENDAEENEQMRVVLEQDYEYKVVTFDDWQDNFVDWDLVTVYDRFGEEIEFNLEGK